MTDESWFEGGMVGAYGVSGRWVYGAIEACQNPEPGGAEYVYQLVDGDTNNRIVMKIEVDAESDVGTFAFFREAEAQPYESVDRAYELENRDDHQRIVASLGDEDVVVNVVVKVPTEAC